LRQEFSKWLERATDMEKARAPQIEEALTPNRPKPAARDREVDRVTPARGDSRRTHEASPRGKTPYGGAKGVARSHEKAPPSGNGFRKKKKHKMNRSYEAKAATRRYTTEPPVPVFGVISVTKRIIKAPAGSGTPASETSRSATRPNAPPRPVTREVSHDSISLSQDELIPLVGASTGQSSVASQLGAGSSEGIASLVKSVANVFTGPIRRSREKIRVQVGLDFGTSTTKVMYQQLGVPERRIRRFLMHSGQRAYPDFAMPSLAVFDKAGQLHLGDAAARRIGGAAWHSGLAGFKMLMAGLRDERFLDRREYARYQEHVQRATGNEDNCRPDILSAVYLAFVMRKVRLGLAKSLGTSDVDLSFNVCVPVDQRENNAVMETFGVAVAVAQELDRSADQHVTARHWVDRASTLWSDIKYSEDDPSNRTFVVPESVASTAAYVTSLQRKPGLHALIDIGAGTTEVSIFNLSVPRKRDVISYWYSARSIPRGAGHVERLLARHHSLDPTSPDSHGELLDYLRGAKGTRDVRVLIEQGLIGIWEPACHAWSEAYGHLKKQSAWTRDTVQVFLAGGGALIPEARKVFAESWMRRWGPYPCAVLSEPDGVDRSRLGAPFARLCVAYGLAIPIPELGRYVLPADAPNHTPPPPAIRDWSRDGDQLIPRYGWT
jgi:hypothetical protein